MPFLVADQPPILPFGQHLGEQCSRAATSPGLEEGVRESSPVLQFEVCTPEALFEQGTSSQVGHIRRAAASAARVAELNAGNDPAIGDLLIEQARHRATPTLLAVLSRYPPAPTAKNRVARLMSTLDASLRASG